MSDFNVRSDSVNVEQIMEQIRGRIREKRGVDYTEQQIRELAAVKLEKFLDPRNVRSDLLEQFRRVQPAYEPPVVPNYAFGETTLFDSHRAPLRWIRKLLQPILKLFFNPNPLIQALHIQSQLNTMYAERDADREAKRRGMDQLYYELIHNLVIELTRSGIELKNVKMRVESLASRLEFNERRARALESVVVYKAEPGSQPPERGERQPRRDSVERPPAPAAAAVPETAGASGQPEGPGQRSRRRRRRRGRRGTGSAQAAMGPSTGAGEPATAVGDSEPAGAVAAREDSAARPEGHDDHGADTSSADRFDDDGFEEPPSGSGSSGPDSQ